LVSQILLYTDYIVGILCGALTCLIMLALGRAFSQCKTRTKKEKPKRPVYLRSVKSQTLWLVLSVVFVRVLTMKGVVPWYDEEMRKSVSVGSKFFLWAHHLFAIGLMDN